MAAEVAGLHLAVWDCSLALPSSECKPRPPACCRGTTRLQLHSAIKRIFKCMLLNWALWCVVSLFTSCVLVSLSKDLAICKVSDSVVCHLHWVFHLSVVLVSSKSPCFFLIVKFMLHVFCLQNGLSWRHNQPTLSAVDSGRTDSAIICLAW